MFCEKCSKSSIKVPVTCKSCLDEFNHTECTDCNGVLMDKELNHKKAEIIPLDCDSFNKTFQEYVYRLEELKLKFISIHETKYKEKDELINDLKSQITKHTNEIVHLIIGYQDHLFNQIDELNNKIKTELDKTLDYQNEMQNHLEDLKYSLVNEGKNEDYLAEEIIQLNADAIHNIDQLEGIGFSIEFEPNYEFDFDKKSVLGVVNGNLFKERTKNCDKLMTVSSDSTAILWNYKTGECLQRFECHKISIICLRILNDNEFFTGSKDCTIKLWNIKKTWCTRTYKGHTDTVNFIQLSHDKHHLISGSRDQSIRIWDIQSGDCLDILTGHTGAIYILEFLDTNILVSCSSDASIKIWNLESSICIKTLMDYYFKRPIFCILIMSTFEILSSTCDGKIKLWNVDSSLCTKTLSGHKSIVECLQRLSQDRVISSSADKTFKVWNLRKGICLKTIEVDTISKRFIVDKSLIIYQDHKNLMVYDLESDAYVKTLIGHDYTINDVKKF